MGTVAKCCLALRVCACACAGARARLCVCVYVHVSFDGSSIICRPLKLSSTIDVGKPYMLFH